MTQGAAGFGLNEIGQIAVAIGDLSRSIEFYRDKLGMKFLFQAPPGLAFFDCAGVRLMLTVPERPGESASSVIYYKVDEIQSVFQLLCGRGVVFEGEPHLVARLPDHDLWMAFFHDPDRNLLGLMSEVPR